MIDFEWYKKIKLNKIILILLLRVYFYDKLKKDKRGV